MKGTALSLPSLNTAKRVIAADKKNLHKQFFLETQFVLNFYK
jgi:hypothetical protein